MRAIFQQELAQIGTDLERMAQKVDTAMNRASKALRKADLARAEQVIDGDDRIDELERDLDEQCISMLARQSPVATDLRTVVAALRMSATLERMGDLAQHVAVVARGRFPDTSADGPMQELLSQMAQAAVKVSGKLVELFKTHNLELALEIEADDEILDDLHRRSFDIILDETNGMDRQQIVDACLLGRYLERFGDHGVSAARRIVFLVTGITAERHGTMDLEGHN